MNERKFLDENGRCCGRKPISYQRPSDDWINGPHRFCNRCCAAFPIDELGQIENWAWKKTDVEIFERRTINPRESR